MSAEQDRILNAIADEGTAKVLSMILNEIQGEPLAAARLIRAFQGAKSAIVDIVQDLPAKWEQLEVELTKADLHRARFIQDMRDFKVATSTEMAESLANIKQLYEFFEKIDSDKFLNKANSILELCDRLGRAKRDGTLDMIQKILKPGP